MPDSVSCVHEIINSAHHLTVKEHPEDVPDLDQLGACLTEHMADLHVEPSDPNVLEGVVVGFSIVLTRVKSWAEHGLFSLEQVDVIGVMIGQLTQAVSLLYAAPATPTGTEMDAMLGYLPA